MRKAAICILSVAVALFCSASLHSSCGTQTVELRHINGIWTSEDGASSNLKQLKYRFGSISNGVNLVYTHTHNSQNGFWDLLFQKEIEDDAEKSRALALAVLAGQKGNLDKATLDRIQQEYLSDLGDPDRGILVAEMTAKISSEVAASIDKGINVVLVPHSQGSLYANEVFKAVTGGTGLNPRLKIVGIAETASYVAGDPGAASYVTATEDTSISLLRAIASGTVLDSNVTAGTSFWTDWFLSHDFQDVYLNPKYGAWPKVRQTLAGAIDSLQPEGKVKVVATWGSPVAVELRMMVNGMDSVAMTGLPDPKIITASGSATYCTDLPTGPVPTVYTPKLINTSTSSQPVNLSGPLGLQPLIVSAQNGIFPGFGFGEPFKISGGTVGVYP